MGDPLFRSKFGLESTEGDKEQILTEMFCLIDRDSSGRISDDELLKEVSMGRGDASHHFDANVCGVVS